MEYPNYTGFIVLKNAPVLSADNVLLVNLKRFGHARSLWTTIKALAVQIMSLCLCLRPLALHGRPLITAYVCLEREAEQL